MRQLRLIVVACVVAWYLCLPNHLLAQRGRKTPPPSEAEIAAVRAEVTERYRDDFAKAKTAGDKSKLAVKIGNEGLRAGNTLVERYAKQIIARDLCAAAGDWHGVAFTVPPLVQTYDIEAFVIIDEVRAKLDQAEHPPYEPKRVYQFLVELIEQAVKKDRYDIAKRLTNSAERIMERTGDKQTAKLLAVYAQDLQKRQRQFESVQNELARLEQDPSDAEANLAVGRYRCFQQGNWPLGVSMLALGSDAELAKLATQELTTPSTAEARLALADSWWNLAETRSNDKAALRRHAVDWYLQAISGTTGLNQRKAQTRASDGEEWLSKDATYTVFGATGEYDRRFPPLASLLNNTDKFHKDGTELAFHLSAVDSYITIDLKREVAITRLQILNRPGGVAQRAKGMTVYVSNSPLQRGEMVWQALDAQDQWNIVLPELALGRYVTIARDPQRTADTAFHLRKVKVFGFD